MKSRLILASVASAILSGCAALPMPLQPKHEDYNSNLAESAWLVAAAVDTAQTMGIKRGTSCDHEADPVAAALYGSRYPKPGRVLVTNLVLMTGHAMVTSWLDDKVAEADLNQSPDHETYAGLWYVSRIVWHAVSLGATGASVISNHDKGCNGI